MGGIIQHGPPDPKPLRPAQTARDRNSRYDGLLMSAFRLRTDLQRAVIDGFALPLGIDPGDITAPTQGYTISYAAPSDDEPDTYAFYVVVSHERIGPIVHRAFDLLPEEVYGIVEISSRDAYRMIDVYLGQELISTQRFLRTWLGCEPILFEDGSIAAGANSDDPFVEIFLDQWKGLSLVVPLGMREEVETILNGFGLQEVPQTWQVSAGDVALDLSQIRPVIESPDETSPDIDDLLRELCDDWRLALNVDPQTNVDDAGRDLGMTLWHAVVGVDDSTADPAQSAEVSVWATAGSLHDMEDLITAALSDYPQWQFAEIHTADRVAFDDRPDELSALAPRRDTAEVHLVQIEPHLVEPDAPQHD